MRNTVFIIISLFLFAGCSSFSAPPATNDTGYTEDANNSQGDTKADVSDTIFSGEDVLARDIQVKCTTDTDCQGVDMTTGPCQEWVCQEGKCVTEAVAKGTECTPRTPEGLDPGCIGGTCDEQGKCLLRIKDGTACDDKDSCTNNDVCSNGVCKGNAKACLDDGNDCTSEACDPATGKCTSTKLGKKNPCNDGNSCSKGDYCEDGKCISGQNDCACTTDDDCTQYDDGNLCNGVLKCKDNGNGKKVCRVDPTTVKTCDTSGDDQCYQTRCAPGTGKCTPVVLAGQACDDNDKCTHTDECLSNGTCKGTAVQCPDDGNDCTSGACDTATGECKTEKLTGTLCTLDDKCRINEKCVAGTCKGESKPCDDGNPCTSDSCDSGKGCINSVSEGKDCDDKNACTSGEKCQADGSCGGGSSTCECTIDADCLSHDTDLCDGIMKCRAQTDGTKKCVNDPSTAVTCDTSDDDDCNHTVCVPATGKCVAQEVAAGTYCDDHDVCTINTTCGNGTCRGGTLVKDCCHSDTDCNDGNVCTVDSCTVTTGKCIHDSRIKNIDKCGTSTDGISKVCWYGKCLTGNSKDISPFSFGKITNASFTGIGAYGTRRFATAARREENVDCHFVGSTFVCNPNGTWTDHGLVYEIKGANATAITDSGLNGQTGNMSKDSDGNYIFPTTAMSAPIADIAYNMVVGWKGAVGLLDFSKSTPKLDWTNAAATALSSLAPGKLASVWHGLWNDGKLFCGSYTHNYLITGTKGHDKFMALCKNTKKCSGDITNGCSCQRATWSCSSIKWDLNTSLVTTATGYSTAMDYAMFAFRGSEVSGMTVASGYTKWNNNFWESFAKVGRITNLSTTTLGSGATNAIGDLIQDVVAVTDRTGLLVTSHHWFWYNSNSKTPVINVTPRAGDDCRFYKAFEYDRQVLVVGVCTVVSGKPPYQLTSTVTDLYYADCAKRWPGAAKVKILTVISEFGTIKTTQGRAVSASNTDLTIVGGNQVDKINITAFLQ